MGIYLNLGNDSFRSTLEKEYADNLLLVGINYDTKTKTHTCKIEQWNE